MKDHHPDCPVERCQAVAVHHRGKCGHTKDLHDNDVLAHKFQPGPCTCGKEELERLRRWQIEAVEELREWYDLCSKSHALTDNARDQYYRDHEVTSLRLIAEAGGR